MSDHQFRRRLRGVILKLIYQNHDRQEPRLDDVMLAGVLERLQYDISVDMVRTTVQDLGDRGLLNFDQIRDRRNGEVFIRKIQITPKGRDLVEGTASDPAVDCE